jgi:spore coat polysaccharide biosynthesis protein SpsF
MYQFEDVLILIQTRMGSTRLPGKVILPFGSSTILGYLYNKLLKAKFSVNQICIATTTNAIDNELIKYLKKINIQYFSGSENDVLLRYKEASKKFNKKIIVRLTADNPLIDANLIKCCIRFHINSPYNVTSTRKIELNRKINRFLPKGSSIDIFQKETLLKINHNDCF